MIVGLKAAKGFKLFKQTYGHDPTWGRGGGGGGGAAVSFLPEKITQCPNA